MRASHSHSMSIAMSCQTCKRLLQINSKTYFSDALAHYRHTTNQKRAVINCPQLFDSIGAPAGIRTPNQQIMSLLL